MGILVYIAFVALAALLLYLMITSIKENVELARFRKRNRETQFSGSAVRENQGFFSSFFNYRGRAESLGERGERRVSAYLEDLPCEDYRVYNDLLIRDGNYTTQVDHVIISRYGVFVLETKNVHGKVYGSGNSEYWKQYLPDIGYKRYGFTQEHQLRNPIWQNGGHIKSLRRLVFGHDIPVYGVVVFPQETDLFVEAEQPVLGMWDVVPYIKQYHDEVLSTEQMSYYRRRLLEVISTSEADRKSHLDNVHRNQERRDAAVASGKCPLCGGRLVLRNGRYGAFYGCSNYPQCKYSHPS